MQQHSEQNMLTKQQYYDSKKAFGMDKTCSIVSHVFAVLLYEYVIVNMVQFQCRHWICDRMKCVCKWFFDQIR